MNIYQTFSQRQKLQAQAGQRDVYQYTELPEKFRVQVVHIWASLNDMIKGASEVTDLWEYIFKTITRELGVFQLANDGGYYTQLVHYVLHAPTIDALDLIELAFYTMESQYVENLVRRTATKQSTDHLVDELNYRLREHGIGYRFENRQIIRVDSEYIHEEVIKPALTLLNDPDFAGASDEFMKAHEHYRHGRNKEAIAEAGKAFESTMKAICVARGWQYQQGDTAKALIEIMIKEELIASSMTSHFTGLRTTLEAGLPTLRNRNAGHGQGVHAVEVPEHYAAYALHLAATNINFLVEAHKNKS